MNKRLTLSVSSLSFGVLHTLNACLSLSLGDCFCMYSLDQYPPKAGTTRKFTLSLSIDDDEGH